MMSTATRERPRLDTTIDLSLGDLPPAELRRWARRAVDQIVTYYADLDDTRVSPDVSPGELTDTLPSTAPEQGESLGDILEDAKRLIAPGLTHWNHPAFFAYFNSSTSGPALLAEMLATAWNPNTMMWASSPTAHELEETVLGWLRQMLGLPEALGGRIYEGGSASTFHALAAARQSVAGHDWRREGFRGAPRLRIYASPHTHSSVDKAVMLLGLGLDSLRYVEMDGDYRLRPEALEAAIREDRRQGWQPWCAVANLGTTSCTSVDPVGEMSEICRREGLWLHVDAAHGGSLAILPEKRPLFGGWENADSIVVNPHKWLMVPIGTSVLFTPHRKSVRDAFSLVPAYLRTDRDGEVANAMDESLALGRPFKALGLWFVLRAFGSDGLRARLRHHLELAREVTQWIDDHPLIERVAPVPMSTVCFRACPDGRSPAELDDLNRRWLRAINASGRAFLSHTELDDRFVLRFVISSLRTERRHVDQGWQTLLRTLREVCEDRSCR